MPGQHQVLRQRGTWYRNSCSRSRDARPAAVGVAARPVEAEPLHRVDDRVDVLLLLFLRVGVVEAQMAHAAVVARQPEIQADRFRVADMQIAVRLGRKAGTDARRVDRPAAVVRRVARRAGEAPAGMGVGIEIALDDGAQEVAGLGVALGGRRGGSGHEAGRRGRLRGRGRHYLYRLLAACRLQWLNSSGSSSSGRRHRLTSLHTAAVGPARLSAR